MKNLKKVLAVTLIVAILSWAAPLQVSANFTVALTGSVTENQANIQNAINAAPADGRVIVTGTQSNIFAGLTLNIPSNVTVEWRAFYVGAPGETLIRLTGNGTFLVSGQAWIENTGSGNAIFAPMAAGSTGNAQITVTGGVVAANTGNAILAEGPSAIVTVSDIGSVFNNAANNLRPAINMTGSTGPPANPMNPLENIRILGGSVASISLDGSGYAIQTYGNVRVEYPAQVFVTNGRAINLVGLNSTATVNGGTVEAIGNGVAISTATTAGLIAQVANAGVIVNGGIVRAVGSVAIQTTGLNSTVTINGGTVSNTSSGAAGNAAIHVTGENTVINISGGEVWSENGRAINMTTSASNTSVNVSGGIVGSRGDGNTIHTMGSVGTITINISGGQVAAARGYAINLAGTGAVNVTGGQVYAMSRFAVYAVNGTFAMNGGFVFAYGSAVGDVVRNAAFAGPTGNGILVGWETPSRLRYVEATNDGLFILPADARGGEVRWTGGGIDYYRSNNSGHLNIPDVTVYSNNGLIFDVSTGEFFINWDGSFTLNATNRAHPYLFQRDNYEWDPVTRTLTLDGFNWYSEMADTAEQNLLRGMQVALYILDGSGLALGHHLTIYLAEGSTNTFRSAFVIGAGDVAQIAGIFVEPTVTSVTIEGSGELIAEGGSMNINGGISGGVMLYGTELILRSGTLRALGGEADNISAGIMCVSFLPPPFTDLRGNVTIYGGELISIGSAAIIGGNSYGIMKSNEINIRGSTVTAIGHNNAFRVGLGFDIIPGTYAYWTSSNIAFPRDFDRGSWWPYDGIEYTNALLDRLVRISTRPAATIGNRVVSGMAWVPLGDTFSVDITLFGITVDHNLVNEFASQWFVNLPNGIIVMANATAGSNTITLTFRGTAFRWFEGPFDIIIPSNILSGDTGALAVQFNPEARFSIVTNPDNPCPPDEPMIGPDGPVYGPYVPPPARPDLPEGPDFGWMFEQRIESPQTGLPRNVLVPIGLILLGLFLFIAAKVYGRRQSKKGT
ncbi:MAG: hypothetical protein FWC20_00985 [Oscillospiraceae bacterium]|nr:hypothetical protein [Oscillospiraceae bacterium]MCL2277967.1 hypothetical protein [Oscillospiraceae bacterium]